MQPERRLFQDCFELHGLHLAVACDDAGIRQAVHDVLDYFGIAGCRSVTSPVDVRLDFLTHGTRPAVPRRTDRLLRHNGLDVYSARGRYYLCGRESVVQIDPASGHARGVLSTFVWQRPGIIRIEFINLIIHSLLLLLRHRDFFPLHAACVAKNGEGVLLVAESDSGKSTQAMNLVRSGWDYLSDDSVLLRRQGDGVEVRPLRRDFGLDDGAEAAFPEIRSHRSPFLTDERKQRIRMASLFPGQGLDHCLPRLLVFPKIVARMRSRLVPLTKAEAMFRLMQQSVLLTIDPHSAASQVDLLRRLTEQARSYELEAGTDVRDDATLSSPLFGRCLSAAI